MKKLVTLICCLLLFNATSKSQYVNIPDSNFRSYLIGKYPSCFNGAKKMDTTCIQNQNIMWVTFDSLNAKTIDGIQYFSGLNSLEVTNSSIEEINKFPQTLSYLSLSNNSNLVKIRNFPVGLNAIFSMNNKLDSIINLPIGFHELDILFNPNIYFDSFPNSLKSISLSNDSLSHIPALPLHMVNVDLSSNQFSQLPAMPKNIDYLLDLGYNQLTSLPKIPKGTKILRISNNKITTLVGLLNDSLEELQCENNLIADIGKIPINLNTLNCRKNILSQLQSTQYGYSILMCDSNNLQCLPFLGNDTYMLWFDTSIIKCLPSKSLNPYFSIFGVDSTYPICNSTNNVKGCHSFPIIKSFVYTDENSNNKQDINEYSKHNIKLTLSNNNYSYTNTNGIAEFAADSLGTYTITATPPNLYNSVPASYTHNFSTYDTLVIDTFALQATVLKDSISIKLTPTNWAARAGRSYPYLVSYENVGTTVLSNAIVGLNYDNSLLSYDSSSNNGVTNNGSSLSVNIGNLLPGQTGSFVAYFKVKTTAALNSSITSIANIATNTVAAYDTISTIVRGSYDPNDKQATLSLTTQQVTEGKFIDYTIRFQNTGTDTAFNVVIADTLDSKLQANQLQMVGSSHSCKTTIKDNIIFFEFLDILLPDSNTNKIGSNGFVSFKIKPISSVASGTIIPNKAAIYFDYNSPVITKPANTIIQNPLPLQLLNYAASPTPPKEELKNWTVLNKWITANEINTSHFIIQRSNDGSVYKSVGSVAAKGSGEYSFIDNSLPPTFETLFYQLQIVDKNGQFAYSRIIKIPINQLTNEPINIVTNPTKNQLQLNIISQKLNNTTASLVNAQGKVVKTFILHQGSQTIDITGFAAGVYYLQSNEGNRKVVVY